VIFQGGPGLDLAQTGRESLGGEESMKPISFGLLVKFCLSAWEEEPIKAPSSLKSPAAKWTKWKNKTADEFFENFK